MVALTKLNCKDVTVKLRPILNLGVGKAAIFTHSTFFCS